MPGTKSDTAKITANVEIIINKSVFLPPLGSFFINLSEDRKAYITATTITPPITDSDINFPI